MNRKELTAHVCGAIDLGDFSVCVNFSYCLAGRYCESSDGSNDRWGLHYLGQTFITTS